MQTVKDYLSKVAKTKGFGYWLGTYGQIATESLWNQKKAQLPSWYADHANAKALWMGKRVLDCIGVDKYARWVQSDGSVPYDSKTDINQEMMFSLAKSKGLKWGTIDTMPDIPGLMVWKQGHIGIYTGNGISRESQGGDYGVRDYNYKTRPWTHWFYNPFIDYTQGEGDTEMIKLGDEGELVKELQLSLLNLGISVGDAGADGDFGKGTLGAVNTFKKIKLMPQDGIVNEKFYFELMKATREAENKAEATLNSISKELSVLKAKIQSSEFSILNLTKERDVLKKATDDLKLSNATLNGALVKKSTELTILQTAHNKMIEDFKALKIELDAKQKEISDLKISLATLDAEDDRLSKELFEARAEIEIEKKEVQEKQIFVDKIRAESQKAKEDLIKTEEELKRCREGFSAMTLGEFFRTLFVVWNKK